MKIDIEPSKRGFKVQGERDEFSFKGISTAESLRLINSKPEFNAGFNKSLSQIFSLLNDLKIKPEVVNQIYDLIAQEVN